MCIKAALCSFGKDILKKEKERKICHDWFSCLSKLNKQLKL